MERRYAVYAWVIGWRRVFTRFSPDFTDRGEEGSRHAGIGITTITGSSATRKLQRQQPTANNRVRFNDRACWRMFKRALNATAWWERRFRPRGGKQIGGRRGGGRVETVRSKTNNGGFREIIVRAQSSATLREWEGILAFMKDTWPPVETR